MTLNPVCCRGCGAAVAYAASGEALRSRVYCSVWCQEHEPATNNDWRRDVWYVMHNDLGHSKVNIAKMFGVKHPQVYENVKCAIR